MHQGIRTLDGDQIRRRQLSSWNSIDQHFGVGTRAGKRPCRRMTESQSRRNDMAGSGSNNRQRQKIIQARVSEQQYELLKAQADAAGLSVSALICFALFDQQPVRASRTPPLDREMAARLLAALGPMACAMRKAADAGDLEQLSDAVEAAQRDLSELRVALFTALGRTP